MVCNLDRLPEQMIFTVQMIELYDCSECVVVMRQLSYTLKSNERAWTLMI